MRTSVLVILLTGAAAQLGAAQPSGQTAGGIFAPGMRLRMAVPSMSREKIVGTIVARVGDTIVVDTVDAAAERRMFFPSTVVVDEFRRVSLPVALIDTAQVSVGRSRLRGMLKTGLVASLIGGVVVGLNYTSGHERLRMRNFSTGFRTGALITSAVAIPIGYRIGQEQWRTVFSADRPQRGRPKLR